MYNTDEIYEYIKKNGEKSFKEIWIEFKSSLISKEKKEEESAIKTQLYMSLLESATLILNANNNWDLKENYTLDQIKTYSSLVFKQEAAHDLQLDKEEEAEDKKAIISDEDSDDEDTEEDEK